MKPRLKDLQTRRAELERKLGAAVYGKRTARSPYKREQFEKEIKECHALLEYIDQRITVHDYTDS